MADDEQLIGQEPLPQPNWGVPAPQNLETIQHYTTLKPFIDDDDNPDNVIGGEVPADIPKKFYTYLTKDFVLTYIRDAKDVERIMNQFDTSVLTYEMSLPPGKYSWETLDKLQELRALVFVRCLRALKGFERRQESTTIQEYTHRQTLQQQPAQQQGNWLTRGVQRFYGGGQQGGM